MLSFTKSRNSGKRLFTLSILLTLFFSYTVIAQKMGAIEKSMNFSFPEKIHKLVLDPLPAGTYSVGIGGYFPTIDSAFNKLSIDGIAGEIILELTDNLYTAPTDSFGFFLNGPILGAGPYSRVTIKPAQNKNVTIEGSGQLVMSFVDASFITIDGIELTGNSTLTFHAIYNNQFIWNSCLDFFNNSDHNVVQKITFISDDYLRYGGGPGFWTKVNFTATPDSNLIQNNFIKKAGIVLYVSSDASSQRATGNIVRGNIIGSETDSLISWGIQVEHCQNTIIENNIVQNIKIMNTVPGGEKLILGINSYSGLGDIIRNNVVHNIKAPSGYTGVGILLSGGSGSNNMVYNNMVYDISSTSLQYNSRVAGIEIWLQNNPKIYYNSVYLSGAGNGANPLGSAAFYIYGGWGNSTNVDARNNIFVNTRNESPYCASSIYNYSLANLTSDYNDLYYQTNQYNCLVRIGSTDYHTLADWQATGKDLNSLNESVNFVSPTDLHINNNYNTLLDGNANPIAGITLDFDGETRNTNTPDIGADEFELSPNATNWQMMNTSYPSDVAIVDFSAVDNQVCWAVGQKYPHATIPYAGFIRTTDGGNTWLCDTIQGVTNSYFQQVFAIDSHTAFVTFYKVLGTSGTSRGIYKTTDGGSSWIRQEAYNNSTCGPGYIHFFDSQNGVVIGDPNLETYTTSNGGLTWNPVTMPSALNEEYTWLSGNGITAIGNTVWFSTGARIFKSIDKGYTWEVILSEPSYIRWYPCIAFKDELTALYSLKKQGALDHLYRKTTDGGVTWNTLTNSVIDNIAPTGLQYVPGTSSTFILSGGMPAGLRGTAVTYDAGENWYEIDIVGAVQIAFPSETVGWYGQWSPFNVLKYVGPRITTVEEEIIDLAPTGYSLSQNYPNPFNPSTTFRYSIPTQSKVVIKVFDILGNEIATLMDEEKSVGTYELTWDATNLPSGVYFYQLKAGSYIETKKMLLLK